MIKNKNKDLYKIFNYCFSFDYISIITEIYIKQKVMEEESSPVTLNFGVKRMKMKKK